MPLHLPCILEFGMQLRSFRLQTFALPSLAALALPPLVIAMGCGVSNAAAQTDKYPRMAAISQYQMEESAEIQLARSAAPNSISGDATILVLRRQGYETAVEGKNGFVCMVARSWMAALDWPEFWNPKVRAADCMNPQAARSILPIAFLRSRMAMAGRSKAEILSAVKAAFENRQMPTFESGAMDYMTHVGPLLVLLVEGTIANERAATDSCVPGRSGELVRRNACGQAS